MNFWEVADKLIVEAKTSYSWVCSQTGVAESTISTQRKYGTEPKVGFAVKFAKLMGVSVETLVGMSGPKVIPKNLEPLVEVAKQLPPDDIDTVSKVAQSLLEHNEKKREESETKKSGLAV